MARRYRRKNRRIKRRKLVRYKMVPNSSRTYTCLVEGRANVTGGATPASLSLAYSMNQPTYYLDNANSWTQMALVGSNYAKAMLLFGEYRVEKMSLTFKSTFVNTTINITPFHDNMIYMINDRDNLTTLMTEAYALQNGVVPKSYNQNGKSPSQTYTNIRKRYIPTPQCTTDPTAPVGASNSLTQYANNYYGIKLYVPVIEEQVRNMIICRWLITFRGLRDTAP